MTIETTRSDQAVSGPATDADAFARASCRFGNPDDWFPAGDTSLAQPRHQAAIRVCKDICPALQACDERVLREQPTDGIWAGVYRAAGIGDQVSARVVALGVQVLAAMRGLADGAGLVSVSLPALGEQVGASKDRVGTAMGYLTASGAVAVEVPGSGPGVPHTYRVVGERATRLAG